MKLTAIVRGETNEITIRNVLYVPNIAYNLISVSQARENDFKIILDCYYKGLGHGKMELFHRGSGKTKSSATETTDELYNAAVQKFRGEAPFPKKHPGTILYSRLGHCTHDTITATTSNVNGTKKEIFENLRTKCTACALEKSTHQPR